MSGSDGLQFYQIKLEVLLPLLGYICVSYIDLVVAPRAAKSHADLLRYMIMQTYIDLVIAPRAAKSHAEVAYTLGVKCLAALEQYKVRRKGGKEARR